MKYLPLKLGIAVVLLFCLLIAALLLWKPGKIRYYLYKLDSDNEQVCIDAVKNLLALNADETVRDYYEKQYNSDVIERRIRSVNELHRLGDEWKQFMYDIFRKRCLKEQVCIPAGSFMMGSNLRANAKPIHEVTLSSFYIDMYEVTNEKYFVYIKTTGCKAPEHWEEGKFPKGTGRHAVGLVTWVDAKAYADWIGMRLPTEAEWEYACRAGSTTEFCFGDNIDELGDYAWYCRNSGRKLHPVGLKKPNKWGIYDMHGGVYEWCADWCDVALYKKGPRVDPKGSTNGQFRALRGGSWCVDYWHCYSAYHDGLEPSGSNQQFGFRLVRSNR